MPGFNPRDFLSLNDAVKQSQAAQAGPPPPTPGPSPFVGNEAYSTTVMPETGEPGPNRSLAGNINFATPQTANNLAQRYGARVVTSNMAGGPTKRNVEEYGLDFGRGDVLNAGVIASRETGNYDRWYDAIDPATGRSLNNRGRALNDELTYGARHGIGPTERSPQMFGAGPQYQFSPVAGQDYRPAGGVSPLANRPTQQTQRTQPRPSLYGAPRTAPQANRERSLYGSQQRQIQRPQPKPFGAPIQRGPIA